jgi:hypothetical protein
MCVFPEPFSRPEEPWKFLWKSFHNQNFLLSLIHQRTEKCEAWIQWILFPEMVVRRKLEGGGVPIPDVPWFVNMSTPPSLQKSPKPTQQNISSSTTGKKLLFVHSSPRSFPGLMSMSCFLFVWDLAHSVQSPISFKENRLVILLNRSQMAIAFYIECEHVYYICHPFQNTLAEENYSHPFYIYYFFAMIPVLANYSTKANIVSN